MENKNAELEVYNLRTVIVSLLLGFFGVGLLVVSYIFQKYDYDPLFIFAIGSIGTTILTVGIISLLYEVLLRRSFINVTQQSIQRIFLDEKQKSNELLKIEKAKIEKYVEDEKIKLFDYYEKEKIGIEKNLRGIIEEAIPPKYSNIKRVGIVDTYDFLEMERLRQKIEKLENTEFKILKIYTPTLNLLESTIINSIENRNVAFRINLLNPCCEEAIDKRAKSLKDYDKDQIKEEIIKNLRRCKSIFKRIEKKENFKVRLYDSFISVPIYGYGTSYIMGLYLHNRLSEEGVQIKVSGIGSVLYKRVDEHFENIWANAKDVNLEDEDFLKKISL
ncbi:hypothetical protein [Aquiflexum lacus]|uniref:hypothetical protein n=1 Tax=Aquiflexum lacus TaxID=2483805 RepID=UPI001892DD8C|nr:hypothetical protein [Aquiflexum lacus]